MVTSISGQNERWAQLHAHQPPPASRPNATAGFSGGWDKAGGATASPDPTGAAGATPSATSGGLSDYLGIKLFAFGGGWGGGASPPPQTTGQTSAAAGATGATGVPPAPAAATPGSQLLTDMESLLSAVTGRSSGANAGATSGATSSGTNAAGTQNGLSGTVVRDLAAVASDLGAIASASPASQPVSPNGQPPGPSPWTNDVSNNGGVPNTGTSEFDGSARRGRHNYSDAVQQQFARSAYSAGANSGLSGTTAPQRADVIA